MANIADSILAIASPGPNGNMARELNEHGQGTYMPRKKDPLFLKRMIELDQDAKVKITKSKTLHLVLMIGTKTETKKKTK